MFEQSLINELRLICDTVTFAPGMYLREAGQHYREMYLIDRGQVKVQLRSEDGKSEPIYLPAGTPIGEIGFLRGTAAVADVVAVTETKCLKIDDGVLQRLNSDHQEATVEFTRSLVHTIEDRQSYNLSLFDGASLVAESSRFKMLLCQNEELLQKAYRLRYEIYCEELGRTVRGADDERRLLRDNLDEFGHTFIAVDGDEVVGSIRANRSSEGDLGSLCELYGMDRSEHHPETTGIVTKLVVEKSRRKSPVAMSMIAAICRYGVRHGITEIYVDSVPQLLHYYRAMGFTVSSEEFMHPDNGPSVPLKINFAKYGVILGREPTKLRLLKLLISAKFHKSLISIQQRRDKI